MCSRWNTPLTIHLRPRSTDLRSVYASEIVKLYIGQRRQLLNAHKSILTKIDYFAKCLNDDRFAEGRLNEVELPEDNLNAWEEILHYLYGQHYQSSTHEPPDRSMRRHYLQTWILADKYCIEDLCNLLIDTMAFYAAHAMIEDVVFLAEQGLETSLAAKYLINKIGQDLRSKGWDDYLSNRHPDVGESLTEHPTIMLEILKAVVIPAERQRSSDGWDNFNPCEYHIHIKSIPCRNYGCEWDDLDTGGSDWQ